MKRHFWLSKFRNKDVTFLCTKALSKFTEFPRNWNTTYLGFNELIWVKIGRFWSVLLQIRDLSLVPLWSLIRPFCLHSQAPLLEFGDPAQCLGELELTPYTLMSSGFRTLDTLSNTICPKKPAVWESPIYSKESAWTFLLKQNEIIGKVIMYPIL